MNEKAESAGRNQRVPLRERLSWCGIPEGAIAGFLGTLLLQIVVLISDAPPQVEINPLWYFPIIPSLVAAGIASFAIWVPAPRAAVGGVIGASMAVLVWFVVGVVMLGSVYS